MDMDIDSIITGLTGLFTGETLVPALIVLVIGIIVGFAIKSLKPY